VKYFIQNYSRGRRVRSSRCNSCYWRESDEQTIRASEWTSQPSRATMQINDIAAAAARSASQCKQPASYICAAHTSQFLPLIKSIRACFKTTVHNCMQCAKIQYNRRTSTEL